MDTTEIKLLDATLTAAEAQEILIHFIKSKIAFHQMKDFKTLELKGHHDDVSVKRIPELMESLENLEKMLEAAKENNQSFQVNSAIFIKPV